MSSSNRRDFIKKSAVTVGAVVGAPIVKSGFARNKPSNQVNVAVVGFGGRGQAHYKEFAGQKNVKVVALCDVDERLFPRNVRAVEKIAGYKPKTYYDIRRLLEDKDVDAISIATPDHWHGLMRAKTSMSKSRFLSRLKKVARWFRRPGSMAGWSRRD
jgi:FlaA1/EpsC-like NDP-sugar epimerase